MAIKKKKVRVRHANSNGTKPVVKKKSQDETYAEFAILFIHENRTGSYKGVHTIISGFNDTFMEAFQISDRKEVYEITQRLADNGLIVMGFAKGGRMIYDPADAPEERRTANKAGAKSMAAKLLERMGK